MVMMAITLAKIGRSMKNRENMASLPCVDLRSSAHRRSGPPTLGARPSGRHFLHANRSDFRARPGSLDSLDDDPVVGLQTVLDDTQLVNTGAHLHDALLNHIVVVDDQEIPAALVDPKRAVRNQKGVVALFNGDAEANENAQKKGFVGVGMDGASL